MKNYPLLLVSNQKGDIFEIPHLLMTAATFSSTVVPEKNDLIPLPSGSDLFRLPGRTPIGFDPVSKKFVQIENYKGMQIDAVGAFMSPAYLQTQRCAFKTRDSAPRLPLYCYTAVGWSDGEFYSAGMRVDNDIRQDFENFDLCLINKKAKALPSKFPGNRLVKHLVQNCVLRYGCPAARNFVLGRWECPIPTSRSCNSACLGCISKQDKSSGFCASHERIDFTPTVEEIVDFVVPHLENAPRPVVSFGQGCEGEPLLEGDLIARAISQIRKKTSKGIININTNASLPRVVEKLCDAGLDSMRVSMSSAREQFYNAYYRPHNYTFDDVIESIMTVRKNKLWASINYLVFPGFTDTENELTALRNLIRKTDLNMIQTRNLNIDPQYYIEMANLDKTDHGTTIGIRNWVGKLQTEFPNVKIGYFNPPFEEMEKYSAKAVLKS